MDAEHSGPSAGVVGQPGAATGVRARLAAVTLDQWLALGVFLAAIAGSSITWYALALRSGFPPVLAAVPTIALDIGGIVFGRNWIFGTTDRLRRWGMITTILAVAISVIGNGAEHAIAAGLLPVTLWLVVAVGAVPPAVLFAIAHQLALGTARVNGPSEVPGKRHGEHVYTGSPEESVPVLAEPDEFTEPPAFARHLAGYRTLTEVDRADQQALAADQRRLIADGHRVFGDLLNAEPEPEPSQNETAEPSTVVELAQRPAAGTKLAAARDEYLRRAADRLDRGDSLDGIVLADVDRAAGAAVGYSKRHARQWRAEAEAAHRRREQG